MTDSTEPQTQPKTALKILLHKGTKLTAVTKRALKSLGCRYDAEVRGYVCAYDKRDAAAALLAKHFMHEGVGKAFIFTEIETRALDASDASHSLSTREAILEGSIAANLSYLLQDIAAYDDTLTMSDFYFKPRECTGPDDEPRHTMEMGLYLGTMGIEEQRRELARLQSSSVSEAVYGGDSGTEITTALIKNKQGDADLFVGLFEDKYLFDPTEGRVGAFYVWLDNRWGLDVNNRRHEDFKAVPRLYIEEAHTQHGGGDDKLVEALKKRSFQLQCPVRRRHAFEMVADSLMLDGTWDATAGRLPVRNGTISLDTGELAPSDRGDLVRSICPVEHNAEAECPKFEAFLWEISGHSCEWMDFMQILIGYAAIGEPSEHVVVYLYGKEGRNGKGTLMNLIQGVLGSMARVFPPEMLLMQRNLPSSSSASPELANLQGVRLALFSEINEGRRIDSARVKTLSGGDTITCRRLFSNTDLQIRPTHTIFLQTNYKPKAPSDDSALWARTVIIPFPMSFVREPKEEHERPLREGLQEELAEELEGILQWVVEGAMRYRKEGLQIPEFVRAETALYRQENDPIGMFLEEACELAPEWSTPKGKVESAIKEFCDANDFTRPTRLEVSAYLNKLFTECWLAKTKAWRGVRINES
jgi:putative DNA primase/helicase